MADAKPDLETLHAEIHRLRQLAMKLLDQVQHVENAIKTCVAAVEATTVAGSPDGDEADTVADAGTTTIIIVPRGDEAPPQDSGGPVVDRSG